MVVVALHQRFGTVHMSVFPGRVLAHLMIGIAVAVSLLVGLVHHVDAPAVAELVEVLAVGIVAGAQKVDVGLLHECDVLFVGGIVHVAPRAGMVVVTIDAAQLHVLAVDLKDLADAFHALHAEVVGKFFIVLAILHAKQLHGEGI